MNPLLDYFRKIELYVTLPSGANYYSNDIISYTESGEVGIRAMTTVDELAFKNPDMLLNGEALKQVLLSCVSGLKRPELLLNEDANGLLLAIKHATFKTDNEFKTDCPKCKHKNTYEVDLLQMLEEMPKIQPEYSCSVMENLNVTIRPFIVKNSISTTLKKFKQQVAAKKVDSNNLSEEENLKLMAENITEIATMNSDLLLDSIERVTNKYTDETVTDKNHIKEFLNNIPISEIKKINNLVNEINHSSTTHKLNAVCENPECKHTWQCDIDVNPINFFTGF